jgi:uncharacterized membrane protein YphA (DoxX/SURF4 family)
VSSVAPPRSGLGHWLLHPWLTIRVQIALGVIFVAAALPKLVDPPSFAHMTYNYHLVPGALLNLTALVMPWLELLAGLGLVLGIWRRTSTLIVGALLVVFIGAISINLARGNAVNCGCFDLKSSSKTQQQLLDEMKVVVARDVGMLLLVAQLLAASRAAGTSRA